MNRRFSKIVFFFFSVLNTGAWNCSRKGDPFQGPKLGSCLTLGNEWSEETHADKARDFIGKGHPGGEQ